MIIFAKGFKEFKNYMDMALENNFPESFILYLFIDKKQEQPVIEIKQSLITTEIKYTLDCDYKNAASVVNEFFSRKKKSDFIFSRKNTPVGLKIKVKEDDRKMDFMKVFNDAFNCERFNVDKADAQTITNKLVKLLLDKKAKYYLQAGFNCEDMEEAFIAGCSAMYDCMMDKVSDSVHSVLNVPESDDEFGNETLTVNEAAEIFQYLLNMRRCE